MTRKSCRCERRRTQQRLAMIRRRGNGIHDKPKRARGVRRCGGNERHESPRFGRYGTVRRLVLRRVATPPHTHTHTHTVMSIY